MVNSHLVRHCSRGRESTIENNQCLESKHGFLIQSRQEKAFKDIFVNLTCHSINEESFGIASMLQRRMYTSVSLKGVFAKNERGYRLNAIKKHF